MPLPRWSVVPPAACAVLFVGLGSCQALSPIALNEPREGVVTFYDSDGSGNCSFDDSPSEANVAAVTMADGLYGNAALCGACAEVEGPLGTVVVRIVDSCPDCTSNHLDLSPQAFSKVAPLDQGRAEVTWRLVTCPVTGNLRYRFKEGSTQYWAALQVLNHRLPLTRLEWWQDGAWVEVPRKEYNYFVAEKGMGTGAVRVRVTALGGEALEDTLPGVSDGQIFEGAGQFSAP